MWLLAFTWGDLAYLALSIFLLAVGLSLAYAFVKLGETLGRVSSFIRDTQAEIVPVINKVGGTVDGVNTQLGKVDTMTDSAVDAVDSVDTAIRAVSLSITRPVQKVSALAAGIRFGGAELWVTRDWQRAVTTGRDAARRREHELAEELSEAGTR